MSEASVGEIEGTTSALEEAKLPPAVRLPKLIQGIKIARAGRQTIRQATRRLGPVFALNVPIYGRVIMVADPALVKQVYTSSPNDLINIQPNMSRVIGPRGLFALDRAEHRNRRKLLTPPFHGKSVKNYERIMEEETLREAATWPKGSEFPIHEPMARITLNVILRTVFGADGAELEQLRRDVPGWVTFGSKLALVPDIPRRLGGRFNPWNKLDEIHRVFLSIVDKLIEKANADPHFDDRTDVLALLLRSRYEDGSPMSRQEIADELMTLVGAGHETTAAALSWVFERLRRHPDILAKLAAEADTDDNELRQATILETQRNRTILDFSARLVDVPIFELGEWRIPRGASIFVSIVELHENPDLFPEPERFDPYRFVGNRPPTYTWLPFGGGARRCIGATYANAEMDVVLRTVLRHFTIEPTAAADEVSVPRGIAYAPAQGGLVRLHRR